MKQWLGTVALVGGIGLSAACSGEALGPRGSVADSAFTITWGHKSVVEDSVRLVLRDSAAWEEFVREHGMPEVPQSWRTDFSRQHVVVAAMGGRPTSGYFICVDSVRARSGGAVAYITRSERGGAQLWATTPAHIVRTTVRVDSMTFHETVSMGDPCQPSTDAEP